MGLTQEFENKELAEFLEDAVKGLFELNPDSVAIVAINNGYDVVGTHYYNCELGDKGIAVHNILLDIIEEYILNNAGRLRQILLEAEDENDDIEPDDDEDGGPEWIR